MEIALGCDFRPAGESARFADTHARVGIVPGWGLIGRLPLAVGRGWARQMSATGNYIDARLAEAVIGRGRQQMEEKPPRGCRRQGSSEN
ncbi:enoyl-CoA hydratase-related protein [Streptomyces sp. NPDC059262]|uniref:enoyl-CoA hydratase-related protein n=1 Tax=Streptomyces sp. NPDC059262 TaxID=3346797 RepID=UPI0036C92EA8